MSKFMATLLAMLPIAGLAHAQDHSTMVPPNSGAFVSVNVANLWDAPSLKPLRDALLKLKAGGDDQQLPDFGLDYANIARVTFVWPVIPNGPSESSPFLLVSTRTPFNEVKLLKTLKAMPASQMRGMRSMQLEMGEPAHESIEITKPYEAEPAIEHSEHAPSVIKEKAHEKKDIEQQPVIAPPQPVFDPAPVPNSEAELYIMGSGDGGFLRLNATTLLFIFDHGNERGTLTYLGQMLNRSAVGPLSGAVNAMATHDIVMAVQVAPLSKLFEGELPPPVVPYQSLLKAEHVVTMIDVKESLSMTAMATFSNAADAARAKPLTASLLLEAANVVNQMKMNPHGGNGAMEDLLKPLTTFAETMLKNAQLTASDNTLSVSMNGKFDTALTEMLAKAPATMRGQASTMETMNNFKQVGLALFSCHDSTGQFPTGGQFPTDIVAKEGTPLLSWRVQILPYIEQENLYKQIDITKSWDDPINKKFWDKMPKLYEIKGRDAEAGMTYIQMPSSAKGFAFKKQGQGRQISSITDGTSNTIMTVEAREAVNWMKPDDVTYDGKTVPKFGSATGTKFAVGMADGSVRMIYQTIKPDSLKAALTPMGGEVLSLDD